MIQANIYRTTIEAPLKAVDFIRANDIKLRTNVNICLYRVPDRGLYFHRYLGHNPFGHKALDIKAYFMGLHGVPWLETSHRHILNHYANHSKLTHHALNDALAEADLFQAMLTEAKLEGFEEER